MKVKQYGIILVSQPVIDLLNNLMEYEELKIGQTKTIEDYAKLIVLYDYLPCNTNEHCKFKTFKYRNQFFILRKEVNENITFFKIDDTPELYNEIRLKK